MKAIPKYVIDLLNRSVYEFDRFIDHPDYAVGYTIRVKKATPYTKVDSLKKEIERLKKWADSRVGCETVYIINIPQKTHYCDQYAIITIFDPLMLKLEQFISRK